MACCARPVAAAAAAAAAAAFAEKRAGRWSAEKWNGNGGRLRRAVALRARGESQHKRGELGLERGGLRSGAGQQRRQLGKARPGVKSDHDEALEILKYMRGRKQSNCNI